jgi:hypothetical protein
VISGERMETCVHAAVAPKELERLRSKRKGGDQMDTENDLDESLGSEKNGILVEGEFAFGKAVGAFLREEVRAGTFKGNYLLHLKKQLRLRSLRENENVRKTRVLLIGVSQMGRLGEELMTMCVDLEVVGCLRLEGENTERENMEMLRELEKKVGTVDVMVVGGPTNSLVRHGKEGERGFGGERLVRIEKKKNGEEVWKVTYQMTDLVKINMVEKAELVDRFVDMMDNVTRVVGENEVLVHATMFPRFTPGMLLNPHDRGRCVVVGHWKA